jgi:hypothetical protein
MKVRPGLWVAFVLSIILWTLIYLIVKQFTHRRFRTEAEVIHNESAKYLASPGSYPEMDV